MGRAYGLGGKRKNAAGRWALLGAGALLIALGGYVVSARAGWLAADETAVQARNARSDARFVEIDGARIRYVDEGEGPAVLLIHGSYLDLGVWDGWASDLARTHRVVRLDRPSFGLSGRDPSPEPGYEREAQLIADFADRLGIENAVVAAASSGGTTAARVAATRPDLVSRLVLINFPLSRGDIKPSALYALSIWIRDDLLVHYQPEWHMRWTIRSNLSDTSAASDALIARLTDEANRPGILEDRRALVAGANRYPAEARMRDLAAITAPTLLIWGADNPLLTVESGKEAYAKVGAAQKRMEILPGASHMVPVEKSAESLALVKEFLAEVDQPGSATE